jgi:hypothetical protein
LPGDCANFTSNAAKRLRDIFANFIIQPAHAKDGTDADMNRDEFERQLVHATALPDDIFQLLYRPLLERTLFCAAASAHYSHPPDTICRALLRVTRLRASVVIPRGLHPEDGVLQNDMWTYAVVASAISACQGFLADEAAARHWIVACLPHAARAWLQAPVAESLLVHCQGRTRLEAPILSLILRGFSRESLSLALLPAIRSIYATAEASDTKHDRFGADLYFPAGCCVLTRDRFDALTLGAFQAVSTDELVTVLHAQDIDMTQVRFAISNAPGKFLDGLCIHRPSALPPYPDLAFE